ncbi:MAG: amidohydrolase family protein [Armatimonadota bacterium]
MSDAVSRRRFLQYTGMAGAAVCGLGLTGVTAAEPINDVGEGVPMAHKKSGWAGTSAEPKKVSSLYKRIRIELDKIPMVDMHEHLWPPHMLAERKLIDATYLLSTYAGIDLMTAGMPGNDMAEIRNIESKWSPERRWEAVKPWYKKTWNTAFCEPVRIAVRDIYGVDDITDETFAYITEKMRAAPKDTWIRTMFDKAGIGIAMLDNTHGSPVFPRTRYPDIFVDDMHDFFTYVDKGRVDMLSNESKISVNNLSDFLHIIDWYFDKFADEANAFKIIRAYHRTLDVDNVPRSDADKLYARFLKGETLAPNEIKAVEDFLIRYSIRAAGQHNLPVKIHTGIPVITGQISRFLNVVRENPNVMFDIYHIGWPYAEELVAMAKFERNIWADFCWSWVMNPVSTRRYLSEMLECVPLTKIHGFGGDYNYAEESYAHAMIAKREITQVLTEKVETGRFTEDYAIEIARAILRDNAMEHFRIKEKLDLYRSRGVKR